MGKATQPLPLGIAGQAQWGITDKVNVMPFTMEAKLHFTDAEWHINILNSTHVYYFKVYF